MKAVCQVVMTKLSCLGLFRVCLKGRETRQSRDNGQVPQAALGKKAGWEKSFIMEVSFLQFPYFRWLGSSRIKEANYLEESPSVIFRGKQNCSNNIEIQIQEAKFQNTETNINCLKRKGRVQKPQVRKLSVGGVPPPGPPRTRFFRKVSGKKVNGKGG